VTRGSERLGSRFLCRPPVCGRMQFIVIEVVDNERYAWISSFGCRATSYFPPNYLLVNGLTALAQDPLQPLGGAALSTDAASASSPATSVTFRLQSSTAG
jgi:hypothetical protein